MTPYRPRPLLAALALGLTLTSAHAADDHVHQTAEPLNFVTGGQFRSYVQQNVTEPTAWTYSMRSFGTLHNQMHHMMGEFGHHARSYRKDAAVPDFGVVMSGGEWMKYGKALVTADAKGPWAELVAQTQVMHDRLHHALFDAMHYDAQVHGRKIDLAPFRSPPVNATPARLYPARASLEMRYTPLEAFRDRHWSGGEREAAHWQSAMQATVTFAHTLSDLTRQWLAYGAANKTGACAPDSAVALHDVDAQWQRYAARVADCKEADWRHLVQVTDLMRGRIHELLGVVAAYDDTLTRP